MFRIIWAVATLPMLALLYGSSDEIRTQLGNEHRPGVEALPHFTDVRIAPNGENQTIWRILCREKEKRWNSDGRRWEYTWRSAGSFENPSRDAVLRHGKSWVEGRPGFRDFKGPFRVNR